MAALAPLASLWRSRRRFFSRNVEFAARSSSLEASGAQNWIPELKNKSTRMRKVYEHVALLQMNEDLSEEKETNMLDNLYTLQYQFKGIVAMSLGRLSSENQEHYTHGVYMRFASRELLSQYIEHPAHLKVAEDFVLPYMKGEVTADFEGEVEDDLEPIFRRGEDFDSGIEHIILLKAKETASEKDVELMLQSVSTLPDRLSPLLVQLTAGKIFSGEHSKGYTHCILARLPSEEALEAFNRHEDYVNVFSERIRPLCDQVFSTDYRVEAIGTTVTP